MGGKFQGDPQSIHKLVDLDTQTQHAYSARNNPQQKFSANHGAPPNTASARPNIASHPSELPPARVSAPNTGNAKVDQKYQKQQNPVVAQQNQERQKLQQSQDREHQQLARQQASPARMQQAEQQHVQQTQQNGATAFAADSTDAAETGAGRRQREKLKCD